MLMHFILKNRYIVIFIIMSFLHFDISLAQEDFSLRGTVRDGNNGAAVPFATIYCKELKTGSAADLQGFFYFEKYKEGRYHFVVSSLGYADLDTLLNVKKDLELTFYLKEKELSLSEVVVTAKASKELPTSSVVKQDALRHLQPNSFADILELLPGGLSRNRDMTSMNLIALRQPIGSASLSSGNKGNEHNSSLGTAFVIDGIPLSNDAQLQNVSGAPTYSGTSDSYIAYRNTTGKGIDMRMLSTDDIESVDIVRGIPSVRFGELTSGLVNIKRSYTSKPLQIRAKATPSSKLATIGKGFAIGKNTLNANLDYLDYLVDPRNEKENYGRVTASLRFASSERKAFTPFFFTTSLDYTGSFDKLKRDKENDTNEEYYKNNYNKIRFASEFTWQKEESFFEELKLSASASYTADKKIIHRIAVGRLSPMLIATEDGEYYGEFLPSSYPAHLEIDGKPLFLFTNLSSQFHWDISEVRNNIYIGGEWRYNKNLGEGEVYDIRRPLYAGNGRPRRSKDIPAMQNISVYAEDNLTIPLGESKLNIQAGVRGVSLVGIDQDFSNFHNKFYFDPRLNLSYSLPNITILGKELKTALHFGAGWHTKLPTLSHLYPNKMYYDAVQLNYYSQNEALRQMQYKLKVIDPTNFELKPNRNKKWEAGITMSMGKVNFEATFYSERMEEGFRHLSNYDVMKFKRYDNSSGPDVGSLTAPPTVDMFTYKKIQDFILYSRYTNGGVEEKNGIEYTLDFGNIDAIKSDVSINGAWMKMSYGQSLPRYKGSSVVIGSENYPYVGYYEWDDSKEYQQFNTNIRFDTKIEELGLIFSSTFQTLWYTLSKLTPNNGMPTYYLDMSGNKYPYEEKHTKDGVLRFLYEARDPSRFDADRVPIAIDYNLKVTKRINKNINLGFYVNRMLYYYPDYHRSNGFHVRRDASPYFGMELNVKL